MGAVAAAGMQGARRKFQFAREVAGYVNLQEGDGQEPAKQLG